MDVSFRGVSFRYPGTQHFVLQSFELAVYIGIVETAEQFQQGALAGASAMFSLAVAL